MTWRDQIGLRSGFDELPVEADPLVAVEHLTLVADGLWHMGDLETTALPGRDPPAQFGQRATEEALDVVRLQPPSSRFLHVATDPLDVGKGEHLRVQGLLPDEFWQALANALVNDLVELGLRLRQVAVADRLYE